MEQKILSVSQVNHYIQTIMDRDPNLMQIAVRGEVSNYKMYPSGHHYFTVKDDSSALKCVMFRGNAMRLKFRPESGMKIIAVGKISVYPRDGAYQLYCTDLIQDGVGDLYVAFEQLKAKLAAQGLFESDHKKPLPAYPGTIGVVTSSAGAAVHDILRILKKRYPLSRVRLLPVRVQGAEAPGEIAEAISYANEHHLADLLIVGRGGGSIEDLWAFNDERVARAIYYSEIPIISAFGHEPDVTISDYVADVRGATPSNAAELAVPDQDILRQNLDSSISRMYSAMAQRIASLRRHYKTIVTSPVLTSPYRYVETKKNALNHLKSRLLSAQSLSVNKRKQRYLMYVGKLDAMSPLKVLSRGYAMVQSASDSIVRSIHQVKNGDHLNIYVSDGVISANVTDKKENGV